MNNKIFDNIPSLAINFICLFNIIIFIIIIILFMLTFYFTGQTSEWKSLGIRNSSQALIATQDFVIIIAKKQ